MIQIEFLTGGGEEVEECPTCTQIEEGSTLPYSDLTCPQCGRRVREVAESRL